MGKKILIIKMSALGDVLIALPHVDAILSRHDKDQVWLLTGPPLQEVFAHHPRLRVAVLDRKRTFGKESTWARIRWVRNQRFDAIYDLQGNRTSRLLVRFSRAPVRVGTQPMAVYNFSPKRFYKRDTQQNVFDRLNETLSAGGLPPASAACMLYPSEEDADRVAGWKESNKISEGRCAVLHAGSSADWPSKRWPMDHFLRLAQLVEQAGIRCVWVGGRADREINRNLSETVGIDATEAFGVLELYLLAKGAGFAVTNDSGPMHILSAAGIPVYSFFGPTSWIRSHAAGQKDRVLKTDMECSPCFLRKCPPQKKHACLESIDPEDVFKKIMSLIRTGGES